MQNDSLNNDKVYIVEKYVIFIVINMYIQFISNFNFVETFLIHRCTYVSNFNNRNKICILQIICLL